MKINRLIDCKDLNYYANDILKDCVLNDELRIAIIVPYYADVDTAKAIMINTITANIPKELMTAFVKPMLNLESKRNADFIKLHNGSIIRFFHASHPERFRGVRIDKAYIQDNIEDKVVKNVFLPALTRRGLNINEVLIRFEET